MSVGVAGGVYYNVPERAHSDDYPFWLISGSGRRIGYSQRL